MNDDHDNMPPDGAIPGMAALDTSEYEHYECQLDAGELQKIQCGGSVAIALPDAKITIVLCHLDAGDYIQ